MGEPVATGEARPWRRYSEGLAAVICHRVADGESLMEVCRDEGMPARDSVRRWRRERPGFAARYGQALAAGRHRASGGRRDSYDPHVASLICERIATGMSVRQACDLEGLPGETTVYGWLQRHGDFLAAYGRARVLQAHRRFDQVWEIAEAAEPGTVSLARLRIDAARWQAARLAPKRYGAKLGIAETVEHAAEGRAIAAADRQAALDEAYAIEEEAPPTHHIVIRKFGAGPDQHVFWPPRKTPPAPEAEAPEAAVEEVWDDGGAPPPAEPPPPAAPERPLGLWAPEEEAPRRRPSPPMGSWMT